MNFKPVVSRIVLGAFALSAVALTAVAAPGDSGSKSAAATAVPNGFTEPYKVNKLSFPTMGIVRDVKVKEGDLVKKGDILMVQDDREDQMELAALKIDAESLNGIEAARHEKTFKDLRHEWAKKLNLSGGQVEREYQETMAEAKIAEVKVKQAEQEHAQAKLKYERQKTRIDRMAIVAPADGVVQKLVNDIGANADPTKESIVVLQNNPLVVVTRVNAMASLNLKPGEKLRVSYDRKDWKEAVVSYLSPEADARSGQRVVHLQLPNPDGHPAGLLIHVELPEMLAGAADR